MSDDSHVGSASDSAEDHSVGVDPSTSSRTRPEAILENPKQVASIIAVAASPLILVLAGGLTTDDHYQYQMARHGTRAPWDLFRFSGSPAEIVGRIRSGEYPWFFAPDGKGAFFRPLSSLGHWVEYRWLGSQTWIAHLHNLVWFAILIATASWVFGLFEGRKWTVGLATILYACSPAAVVGAAWIAARNSLMSATFGFAALGLHHLWRTKVRRGPAMALGFLLAALASGESSAGPLMYLLGYAALVERGPALRRLLSVLPYAVLAAVWFGVEYALGYGSAGNSVYSDVHSDPAALAPLFASRIFKLAEMEFGWTGLELLNGRFEALKGAGTNEPGFAAMLYFLAALLALAAAAWNERMVRFWFTSSAAALLPFCFTLPQPRLLLAAHFGVSIGLAHALETAFARLIAARSNRASWLSGGAVAVLVVSELGFGWPSVVGQSHAFGTNTLGEEAVSHMFDSFAGKDVVCVSGDWFVPHMARMVQEERGTTPVRSVLVLASSLGFVIERPDPRTLIIRSPASLLGLGDLLRTAPFRVGERIRSTRAQIEILAVNWEQKPTAVRYLFDTFLEDGSLAWTTTYSNGIIGPVPPIPVQSRFTVLAGIPFAL